MTIGVEMAVSRLDSRWSRATSLLGAFVRRDAAMAWSYRLPFVVGLVQSVLVLGMLYFLGRLVDRHVTSATGLTGGYFGFAVMGTTMLLVFTSTLQAVSQRLRTDQTSGTLEVVFTLPPSPTVSVLGGSVFQVAYAMAGAIVTVLAAMLLGLRFHLTMASGLTAFATLCGAIALYSAASMVFGAYILVFKRGETLMTLAVSALAVLGGIYYPISLLPGPLRTLADLLPFTWVVSVLRSSLLAGQAPLRRLALVWAFALGLSPVALWLFQAALKNARTKGTLGQY